MMRWMLPGLLVTAVMACVPKPKQDYTLEQLGRLDSLEELMHVQAHVADPLFKKRQQTSFSADEYQAMVAGARRVQVTATTLRDRFAKNYEARFGELAGQLREAASELLSSAEASQPEGSARALERMRQACATCHKHYK